MPIELFGKLTQKTLKKMESMDGEQFNFHWLLERFTLDVIGLAGFGMYAFMHCDT